MNHKYEDILNQIESTFEADTPQTEEEKVVFWYSTPKGTLKIDFRRMRNWLQDKGFFRFEFVEGKVNFIRVNNNIIENVTAIDIKNFVLNNLDQWDENDIWNVVYENAKFKDEYLSALKISEPNFITDDRYSSWFFYLNTAVKVSTKGIEKIPYSEIDGCIWKSSIIKRNFEQKDFEASDFYKFMLNVCAQDKNRLKSLKSSTGYLLHRFKDPSNTRGVIYYEEQIGNNPVGGTGKTLLFQALGEMRELVTLDAKSYDNNNQFALQRVNPSTNIVLLDDLPINFKYENLFSKLTTGLPIGKKHKPEIYLPYAKSPKFCFPSNYVVKGNSSSFKRRKFEIEIHPFYNEDHQPIDDFNRTFWGDQWTDADWNMFDTLMLKCCQLFLAYGLITPEYVNLDIKKVMAQTSQEFFDWACENLNEGGKYHRNAMFKKFQDDEPGSYCKSANMFYNWMREFANYKGWDVKDNVGSGKMYIQFGEGVQQEFPVDFTEDVVDSAPF